MTINHALGRALDRLCDHDKILFENDASERSICHRLALYLEDEFPDFDVDCEYNCDCNDPRLVKRLYSEKLLEIVRENNPEFRGDSVTVYPDIIIHHRNTNRNLLVIEAKKTTSGVSVEYDMEKLRAYKKELGYVFAKFLKFGTRKGDDQICENRFVNPQ